MKHTHHPVPIDAFEPLVAALSSGRYLRVVARPGWVTGDPPFGPCTPLLDTPWSAEQHARAHAACLEPQLVGEGIHAAASRDGIVISWVPQAFAPADLVREQVISPLAMRLLSAALSLGRNVLLSGAHNAALPLMWALVGEGTRPALVGADFVPAPPRWLRMRDLSEAAFLHADRIGICGVPAATVVELACGLCGVVAYSPAQRLEQALMRYELGAAELGDGRHTPLQVLAGIDLVVQLSVHGPSRVTQVSEIALTEAGYRPHILFSAGAPPAPAALVPRAPPSFLQELAASGHGGLADELAALAPGALLPPAVTAAAPPAAPPALRSARTAGATPRPTSTRPWPASRPAAKGPDGPPPDSLPGWELDRLPPPEAETGAQGVASADDAVLAATYGLAPPPRPGSARTGRPFEDALAQVRSAPRGDADAAEPGLPYLPPDDGDDDEGGPPNAGP